MAALTPIERARLLAFLGTEVPPSVPLHVHEYVALGRYPHTGWLGRLTPADTEAVDRAMADVGLMALVDRDVARLSDGERQRVILARGLAQQPRVLLLDEPTAHLDIAQRCILAATLRRVIERDGLAVVLSTHDLEFAMQVADRVWLLAADGSLAADTAAATLDRRTIETVFGLHATATRAETSMPSARSTTS
jgi:iron complex transport system ATP-binding protein